MDWGMLIAFLGSSILLTLMPGPDILFVFTQSIAGSRKEGAAAAFGLCTGLLAHITAAALGISAVVYGSEAVFRAVQIFGAAYLFYLAWQSWRSAGKPSAAEEDGNEAGDKAAGEGGVRRRSFWRLYRRGMLMSMLNPKVSLFFVAFLPQFVVPGGRLPVAVQMIVLGGVFLVQSLFIFQLVALLAGRAGSQWIRGGTAKRRTARIQAVIYALLGAQILFLSGS